MANRLTYIGFLTGLIFFFSCNSSPSHNHGPIVLGDSSTIVTERDASKLQDLVTDLKPVITSSEPKDTEATAIKKEPEAKTEEAPNKETATTKQQPPAAPLTGAGIKADFNIMSLLIPNVTAKLSGNPNLERANGVVYTYVSGNINGNVLKVTANVTRVSQRYQSVIVLKNEMGVLPLESLSTTTSWEPLKSSGNAYRITGLDEKSLEYADANHNIIRNAVSKAASRRRFSRRKVQEWVNSLHNVRAANQKPLYVMLRSVMWKIDGKDATGKPFSKQVRIDIPL